MILLFKLPITFLILLTFIYVSSVSSIIGINREQKENNNIIKTTENNSFNFFKN
jgi:dolichol kinase